MTSIDDTCNSDEIINDWSEIDWTVINKEVKSLRRRIFQAKQNGNTRRLRTLQKLMLKSTSNILFSMRDILNNSGGETKGVDGMIYKTSREKISLFYEIKRYGIYGKEPKPTRRIYIKEPTKMRPIGIPTIYDRIIQKMVKNSLEPEWEAVFEKGSYGFRPNRNVDDAIHRVWTSLTKPTSRKWILDSDISKCFDSISHDFIMQKIQNFPAKELIYKWLKTGIIISGIWLESGDEGTPQGSSLSPLLCNIALHGMEEELGVIYDSRGYVSNKGRSLIRFADDLVILCKSKEDAYIAKQLLNDFLKMRGLELSETKTKIVHITEGFDFLGYNIRLKPKGNKSYSKCISNDGSRIIHTKTGIYVSPSIKSIKKIKRKLKETMVNYYHGPVRNFIKKMNELIRGYAQSKWHWHSARTFSHLNNYVYRLCWRWASRKHPKKSKTWIKEKYFTNLDLWNLKDKWVFHDKDQDLNKYFERYLFKFHWFKINTHVSVKMDKCPDRKDDKKYYNELRVKRLQNRPFNIFYRMDNDLALSQHGLCPVCNMDLYIEGQLDKHHIIPKKEGGKFTFSNLVLVHQICHRNIHRNIEFYKKSLTEYRKKHQRPKRKNG